MAPVVTETYWRLCEEAEHTLVRLAVARSKRCRREGLPPGNALTGMRIKLDGALHTFTALMIASARLGPPGTAAQGTPPVPMPSVFNASWPEPGQGPGSERSQLRPGPLVGPADEGPDQDEDGLYATIPR